MIVGGVSTEIAGEEGSETIVGGVSKEIVEEDDSESREIVGGVSTPVGTQPAVTIRVCPTVRKVTRKSICVCV